MVESTDDYQERLKKEQRRRKIRMFRHSFGLILTVILLVYLFLFTNYSQQWMLLIVGGTIYIVYVLYKLVKEVKTFLALDDELHYEDGAIIKFNVRLKKTKKRIPIENVEEVYLNIEEKPDMLYVIYMEEGNKRADSFYKQRIKGRDDLMYELEKKSLLKEESISYDRLRELMSE